MMVRHFVARSALALGVLALGVVAAAPRDASARTIAYAIDNWFGFEYLRLQFDSPREFLGSLDHLPATAAFAGDYSTQYMVDLAVGRLYSIDVNAPFAALVGIVDMSGKSAAGMHWDPTSAQMFLIATDDPCTTTTLYTVDVSDASSIEIGSTPHCIMGLAIDAEGRAWGIDRTENALVSIDTATGTASPVGPLGLDVTGIGGFDVDPATDQLYLFAFNEYPTPFSGYRIDTERGHAIYLASYPYGFLAMSFADSTDVLDAIMANGFER